MSANSVSKPMKFPIFIVMICVVVAASEMLVGGLREQPTDDENVRRIASFSADRISKASNSAYHMKLVDVKEASTQVVAGIKYRLKVVLGPTECKKNAVPPKDISECQELECMPRETCDVTIWEKKWENFTEIQEFHCSSGEKRC